MPCIRAPTGWGQQAPIVHVPRSQPTAATRLPEAIVRLIQSGSFFARQRCHYQAVHAENRPNLLHSAWLQPVLLDTGGCVHWQLEGRSCRDAIAQYSVEQNGQSQWR
jgi:hypothetical protein